VFRKEQNKSQALTSTYCEVVFLEEQYRPQALTSTYCEIAFRGTYNF
jgi:hypothetical protein